jgi:hypothetical protein
MTDEYTPDTELVKRQYKAKAETRPLGVTYTSALREHGQAFDRWLASVKAEAWDEGYGAGKVGSYKNPHRTVRNA